MVNVGTFFVQVAQNQTERDNRDVSARSSEGMNMRELHIYTLFNLEELFIIYFLFLGEPISDHSFTGTEVVHGCMCNVRDE